MKLDFFVLKKLKGKIFIYLRMAQSKPLEVIDMFIILIVKVSQVHTYVKFY